MMVITLNFLLCIEHYNCFNYYCDVYKNATKCGNWLHYMYVSHTCKIIFGLNLNKVDIEKNIYFHEIVSKFGEA